MEEDEMRDHNEEDIWNVHLLLEDASRLIVEYTLDIEFHKSKLLQMSGESLERDQLIETIAELAVRRAYIIRELIVGTNINEPISDFNMEEYLLKTKRELNMPKVPRIYKGKYANRGHEDKRQGKKVTVGEIYRDPRSKHAARKTEYMLQIERNFTQLESWLVTCNDPDPQVKSYSIMMVGKIAEHLGSMNITNENGERLKEILEELKSYSEA